MRVVLAGLGNSPAMLLAENARQLHVSIRTAFLFNVFILSFCKRE
jgi:hypothetical protein